MHLTFSRRRALIHRPQYGLSIVELLVGITIGLFVLAGATALVSGQLSDNRRLLLETQIHQDLRAASDIISRDLRRAGYFYSAVNSVWPKSAAFGGTVVENAYQVVSVTAGSGGRSELNYAISSAKSDAAENNAVDSDEQFGFAWDSAAGTIVMKVGNAGWQALTDSNVVNIIDMSLTPTEHLILVPCVKPCPGGPSDTSCWPRQKVRHIAVLVTGRAVHDASVVRSVQTGVRVRNDSVTGACPV